MFEKQVPDMAKTIFESEQKVSRQELSDHLKNIANKIENSESITLSNGSEHTFKVADSPELELKLEEGRKSKELEIEIEWSKDSDNLEIT